MSVSHIFRGNTRSQGHNSCMEENVVDRDQINKEGKEDDMIYVHITTRIIKEATARRADTKM